MLDRLFEWLGYVLAACAIAFMAFYVWYLASGSMKRDEEAQISRVVSTETYELRQGVHTLQTQVAGQSAR